MKSFIKMLVYLLVFVAIVFGGFLLYMTLDDYSPEYKTVISENSNPTVIADSAELNLFSWNIGYCGLNKEMDFFYSGGTQVYPDKDVVFANVEGVKNQVNEVQPIDFMLFQEVDKSSLRSHFTNQVDTLSNMFRNYSSTFAKNYDVAFVPMPLSKPMGSVNSGLLTISKYIPISSVRYSYEGNFVWPKALFMLDRCYMVNRYKLSNGKQLLMINTHNSAYDTGGLRKAQMIQIREFVKKEYELGNYIIVGGDWNQCAPGFKDRFSKDKMDFDSKLDIEEGFMSDGWTWFYDNREPTNRRNKIDYKQGITATTVIDFFLLSPNIEANDIQNISNGFTYSDHQPVKASVKLISK